MRYIFIQKPGTSSFAQTAVRGSPQKAERLPPAAFQRPDKRTGNRKTGSPSIALRDHFENADALVARIKSLGPALGPDEIRALLYTPGFLALLKTSSETHLRILEPLFFYDQTRKGITLIVEQLIEPLRRYSNILTKDPTDADNLLQDCLEHALRSWHPRQANGDARAWTFTLMRNLAQSRFRQQSDRGVNTSFEDVEEPASAVSASREWQAPEW
jgi:hypothetical protein